MESNRDESRKFRPQNGQPIHLQTWATEPHIRVKFQKIFEKRIRKKVQIFEKFKETNFFFFIFIRTFLKFLKYPLSVFILVQKFLKMPTA